VFHRLGAQIRRRQVDGAGSELCKPASLVRVTSCLPGDIHGTGHLQTRSRS
jgi:hypothetical protein